MKPLLSIAVPTYNRSDNLSQLCETFLFKVVTDFDGDVDVIVCDNSDFEPSERNQAILKDSNITYKKNKMNLGFSGNIVRCMEESTGEFVWIISDDDDVNYDAFCKLIKWLKHADVNDINAIMLPFYNYNESGDKYLMNTKMDWGNSNGDLCEIIANTSNIPFVLFSGLIVRNLKENKESLLRTVGEEFAGNDFIQIPLFMSIIGKGGKLDFYPEALQEYRAARHGRFSLKGLIDSMEQVVTFVSRFYTFSESSFNKLYYQCHYRRWMSWMLMHRAGVYVLKDADEIRWAMLWKWKLHHLSSLHNLAVACMCISPKPMVKFVYKLKSK